MHKFRAIIHLDMDAFYASVEVLDNPALKGKPVIVGGHGNRGVVSAASYEARTFGVHSAMPLLTARKLCQNGVFLPVRMERYKKISNIIHSIFHKYTPLVEPISLDEAFLDITNSKHLEGTPEQIAEQIRAEVYKTTGLTVSAGVATSKLVAKIASDLNKPNGLTVVPPGTEEEFLAPLPIGKLWGVGKSTQKTFDLLGVQTIGDLSKLPLEFLEAKFGKHGIHLHQSAKGIDERSVIPERETKSIGHEITFSNDIIRLAEIEEMLLALAVKVGRRLRRYNVYGSTVTLKVKYHDFKQITRSITLTDPTHDSGDIYNQAKALLSKTLAGKKPIRLLGISLSSLTIEKKGRQIHLFEKPGSDRKREKLNQAVDDISDRFGAEALKPGRLLSKKD